MLNYSDFQVFIQLFGVKNVKIVEETYLLIKQTGEKFLGRDNKGLN